VAIVATSGFFVCPARCLAGAFEACAACTPDNFGLISPPQRLAATMDRVPALTPQGWRGRRDMRGILELTRARASMAHRSRLQVFELIREMGMT
jgi:hypothetical protein